MRRYFVLLASFLMVFTACRKEKILTPSVDVPGYTLPQGNHSYDDSIVKFYQKYNCYILYRFTHADFAYNYTTMRPDSAFSANPAYIGNALRFFYDQLVTLYPESFLKKTLPFKVLLASYIGTASKRDTTGFASTISALTIGWADSTLVNKTPAEIKKLRGFLHRFYMERAYRVKSVDIPQAFIRLAPYEYNEVQPYNKYAKGVIGNMYGADMSVVSDFLDYIEAITSHSKAELEATLLSPAVDTKGLIRRKYEIVVNYFTNNFDTNLQAVGEKP